MNRDIDFIAGIAAGQIQTHRPEWSILFERRDGTCSVAFPVGQNVIHLGRATLVPDDEWVFEDGAIASVVLDAPAPVSRDPLDALGDPDLDPDRIRMLGQDPHFVRLLRLKTMHMVAVEGVDRLVGDLGVATCLTDPRELRDLVENLLRNALDLQTELAGSEMR
jgi:hypothetical protein